MSQTTLDITQRERELAAIIEAYNQVTERLKSSHEQLGSEVRRLREELTLKSRQLRRRERLAALGEMAAGVAHEIRNPLGGIRLFASLLEKDLADKPESMQLAVKIGQGVRALETIVADILEFSRPCEPQPRRVLLSAVAAQALELCEGKAAGAGVRLEQDEQLDGVELATDGTMLGRALLNLALNAVDAAASAKVSPAGETPMVRIGLGADTGERVCVTVSDTGPGIPADLMDRIFNPFFTTKDSGTGLGLAIVHQIAEALGGTIQAANRNGGGAVFTLSVPREVMSHE